MTVQQIMQGISCTYTEAIGQIEISHIHFDSRKVEKGSMFFCINGETTDGHLFARMACDNGAAVIVAEHMTDADLPHIIVGDSRMAMFYACANFYDHPEQKVKLIGVTGTNGKTSTTFFIKEMLEDMGKKCGLLGTVRNMIGQKVLPSSFTTPEPSQLMEVLHQMAEEKCEYVIMEISSHALAQRRVAGLDFEVGVFTNLTQDHLDYHKTMENYKEAKYGLFLQSKNCVFNIDDAAGADFAARECKGAKRYTYSANTNDADVVARDISLHAGGVDFIVLTAGALSRVSVTTPGKFTVYNVTAAISALYALGISFEQITAHLSALRNVDGRAQIVPTGRDFTVMLDYAHTPDALENILRTIRSYATGRIVTVFGCGGDRDKTKRPLMGEMAARYSDFLVVTSDNPRTEDPDEIIKDILPGVKQHDTPYEVITLRKEAIGYALAHAQKDDVILLAGKGHEKYQILGKTKIDFDEEAIVREFLKEI